MCLFTKQTLPRYAEITSDTSCVISDPCDGQRAIATEAKPKISLNFPLQKNHDQEGPLSKKMRRPVPEEPKTD